MTVELTTGMHKRNETAVIGTLQSLAAEGFTGVLHVTSKPDRRAGRIQLLDGNITACHIDGYRPRIARRLLTAAALDEVTYTRTLTLANGDETHPDIPRIVVTHHFVDASVVTLIQQEILLASITAMITWAEPRTRTTKKDKHDWQISVQPLAVTNLWRGLQRREEYGTRIWRSIGQGLTVVDAVPMLMNPTEPIPDVVPGAAVYGQFVDGIRRLDEVAGECGLTRYEALHITNALVENDVIRLRSASSPAVVAPAPTGRDPRADEAFRDANATAFPTADDFNLDPSNVTFDDLPVIGTLLDDGIEVDNLPSHTYYGNIAIATVDTDVNDIQPHLADFDTDTATPSPASQPAVTVGGEDDVPADLTSGDTPLPVMPADSDLTTQVPAAPVVLNVDSVIINVDPSTVADVPLPAVMPPPTGDPMPEPATDITPEPDITVPADTTPETELLDEGQPQVSREEVAQDMGLALPPSEEVLTESPLDDAAVPVTDTPAASTPDFEVALPPSDDDSSLNDSPSGPITAPTLTLPTLDDTTPDGGYPKPAVEIATHHLTIASPETREEPHVVTETLVPENTDDPFTPNQTPTIVDTFDGGMSSPDEFCDEFPDDLHERLRAIQATLHAETAAVADADQMARRLRTALADAQAAHGHAAREVEAISESMAAAEEAHQQASITIQEHTEAAAAAAHDHAIATQAVTDAQTAAAQWVADISRHQDAEAAARQRSIELTAHIETLKAQLADAETELQQTHRDVDDHAHAVSQATTGVATAENDLATAVAALAAAQDVLQEQETQLAAAQEHVAPLLDNLQAARAPLAVANRTLESTLQRLESAQREAEQAASEADQLRERLDYLNEVKRDTERRLMAHRGVTE